MLEEHFISGTEIIEPGLTGGRFDEAILRTTAVADKTDLAVQTVLGQSIALVRPKFPLEWRVHHLFHWHFVDIAQMVFWEHIMVARVEVAVMLNRHGVAARLIENT